MEVKKSPKADLEGKKSTWLLIGYVFILALMFVAFEWTDPTGAVYRLCVCHFLYAGY